MSFIDSYPSTFSHEFPSSAHANNLFSLGSFFASETLRNTCLKCKTHTNRQSAFMRTRRPVREMHLTHWLFLSCDRTCENECRHATHLDQSSVSRCNEPFVTPRDCDALSRCHSIDRAAVLHHRDTCIRLPRSALADLHTKRIKLESGRDRMMRKLLWRWLAFFNSTRRNQSSNCSGCCARQGNEK